MMNKIYDFKQIDKIRAEQKKLIWYYLLCAVCFVVLVILASIAIKNNILLTVIFAFALFVFILYSIVFWKIKYGILKEYRAFLDNIETGSREDCVGVFEGKAENCTKDDNFDMYMFTFSNRKRCFLIDKLYEMSFVKGEKYHLECVGDYIVQWEMIE